MAATHRATGTAIVTLPTDEQILITRAFAAPRHLVLTKDVEEDSFKA